MARRIALVVSADSGEELLGGTRDAKRVYSLLTDENLGDCDPSSPMPIVGCGSRKVFQEAWHAVMERWNHQDQLLFYFSGHGAMKNGKYVLAFGPGDAQQYLPFDHLLTDLQAHGVRRAIAILDACHSGAATRPPGAKEGPLELPRLDAQLPEGVAVLSSCRESEQSFEFEGDRGSVFTHLLTQGIRSGLGGKPTPDNLIGPDDIIDYINARMFEPEYAKFPQKATYQVSSASDTVWIARNVAQLKEPAPGPARSRAYSLEELHILYERTDRARHPCLGATLESLDWKLVDQFARASGTPIAPNEPQEQSAQRLGLYSSLSERLLDNAAVLCFAHTPHVLIRQARAIFIRGDRTSTQVNRVDVLGPLSRQVEQLTQLVMEDVHRRLGWRASDRAASLLSQTVREAVSNAITHRDYTRTELVRVAMNPDSIEITNPGVFPNGSTFDSLLCAASYSAPNDAAIAWYLTKLLAYEGVGRGFSVYNAFRSAAGSDAIRCDVHRELGSLKLTIRIPLGSALSPPMLEANTVTAARPERATPSAAMSETLHGVGSPTAAADVEAKRPSSPPEAPFLTATGELVGERYRLGPAIGTGGSGSVYLAEDTRLLRQVAIKILSKRFGTPEARARFIREASLAARIDHPGIVKVYDVGEESDRLFIVMELVTGPSLQILIEYGAVLREQNPDSYFLQIAWLAQDIAEALVAAHAMRVIHRDIKPGNVIVDESGRARILDFGISRAADDSHSSLTVTGVVIGTPQYMSPEQFASGPVDELSDVYSLGIVLYELLCGKPPFEATSFTELAFRIIRDEVVPPRQYAAAIPAELERICLKAMSRERDARYASAQDMASALKLYLPNNPQYDAVGNDRKTLWSTVTELVLNG